MKNLQLISNGRPILINLDQVVAMGVLEFNAMLTWIDCVNGEEYHVDTPFEEILKYIPKD